MASIHDVDALIVVGPILWKCVNCDKLLSRHHSIDSHLAVSHRSKIDVHAAETGEEFMCNIDGCSCQSSVVPRVKKKPTEIEMMPRSSVKDSICHGVGFLNSKGRIDVSDRETLSSDDEDVPQKLRDLVEKASMKQSKMANVVPEKDIYNGEMKCHGLNSKSGKSDHVKPHLALDLCGFHVSVRFMGGDNETSAQEHVLSSDAAKRFKLFQANVRALDTSVKWQRNGSFLFLNELEKNYKSESNKNGLDEQKPETLGCGLCGKSFSSKEQFVKHVKLFESVAPFVCGNCLCLFHDRFDLHHHQLRTHCKLKRNFPCSECSQLSPTLNAALNHLEQHRCKKLMSKQQICCGSVGATNTKSLSQKNTLSLFRRKKLDTIIKRKRLKEMKTNGSNISNKYKYNVHSLAVWRRKHSKQKTGTGNVDTTYVKERKVFSSHLCFLSENNQSSPQNSQEPLSKLERKSWNKSLQMKDKSARVKNKVKKHLNGSEVMKVCKLEHIAPESVEILEADEPIGCRRSGRANKGRHSLYNEYEVEFT